MRHSVAAAHDDSLSRFFANVFAVMAVGLAVTGTITLWISHSPDLMKTLFGLYKYIEDGETKTGFSASGWWWFAAIVELGLVLVLCHTSFGKSVSIGGNLLLFILYAGLNGVTLSPMIYSYTDASVAMVFFITAGTFSGCALFGHVTKINLLPMQSFFMVGLIGLLVVLVVNIFYHSPAIDFAISGAAVLLFAGLTAFDMQKLREMYEESGDESVPGLVIYGALTLYLDFINLLIHLLRIFGVKKD